MRLPARGWLSRTFSFAISIPFVTLEFIQDAPIVGLHDRAVFLLIRLHADSLGPTTSLVAAWQFGCLLRSNLNSRAMMSTHKIAARINRVIRFLAQSMGEQSERKARTDGAEG